MLEHQMPAYYVIVNSCQTNLCLQTVTMLVNNHTCRSKMREISGSDRGTKRAATNTVSTKVTMSA